MTTNETPTTIRRLNTPDAVRLARLVSAYDDLQTVLRSCERLMALLAAGADDLDIEALWTLALLSYARLFAEGDDGGGGAPLTEDDLSVPEGAGDRDSVQQWHRVFLHLRDHQADATANPRETYTAGVALDADGVVNAVAVTSVHSPAVDEGAVRQVGAVAYPLLAVLDERIDALQKQILDTMRDAPKSDLESMDLIEVATAS